MFNEDKRLVDLIHLIPHGEKLRSVFAGRSAAGSRETSPIDGLPWRSLYEYCNKESLMDLVVEDLEALRE